MYHIVPSRAHQLLNLAQALEAWRVDAYAVARLGQRVNRRGSHGRVQACQLITHLLLQGGTSSGCEEQQGTDCRHQWSGSRSIRELLFVCS
jgi:hypothetical protein